MFNVPTKRRDAVGDDDLFEMVYDGCSKSGSRRQMPNESSFSAVQSRQITTSLNMASMYHLVCARIQHLDPSRHWNNRPTGRVFSSLNVKIVRAAGTTSEVRVAATESVDVAAVSRPRGPGRRRRRTERTR